MAREERQLARCAAYMLFTQQPGVMTGSSAEGWEGAGGGFTHSNKELPLVTAAAVTQGRLVLTFETGTDIRS